MARIVMLLLKVALVIILLRSPYVRSMLQDLQATASSWLSELEHRSEKQALDELKTIAGPIRSSMRPFQQEYLSQVLQSKDSVKHFYTYYCQKTDMNPYIEDTSRTHLCNEISKSSLLTTF